MVIVLVEDKKDYKVVLLIFNKICDIVKELYIFVNFGYMYVELKQFLKVIEYYEIVLVGEGKVNDFLILVCFGCIWFNRGRVE